MIEEIFACFSFNSMSDLGDVLKIFGECVAIEEFSRARIFIPQIVLGASKLSLNITELEKGVGASLSIQERTEMLKILNNEIIFASTVKLLRKCFSFSGRAKLQVTKELIRALEKDVSWFSSIYQISLLWYISG